MRLGLLTAPFPERPLTDVVEWTAANGFESIEIACWPRTTGPTRRYAGTSHIDVANLTADAARDLAAQMPEAVRQILFGAIIVVVAAAYTRVTDES